MCGPSFNEIATFLAEGGDAKAARKEEKFGQKFRQQDQSQPVKKNNSEKGNHAKKIVNRAIFHHESNSKDANAKSPYKTPHSEDFGTAHAEKVKFEKTQALYLERPISETDFLNNQKEPVIGNSQFTEVAAASQRRRTSNTMKSSKLPKASIRPVGALVAGATESPAPVTPGLVVRPSTPTLGASKQSSPTPVSQGLNGMSLPARSEVKDTPEFQTDNQDIGLKSPAESGNVVLKISAKNLIGGSLFIGAQVQFEEQGISICFLDATGDTRVMRSTLPGPIYPEQSSFRIGTTGEDLSIMLKTVDTATFQRTAFALNDSSKRDCFF